MDALHSRPIQVAALLMVALIASMAAPTALPDSYRVGYGIGVLAVGLVFSTLVLVWRKAARGFIPILALVLSAPLVMLSAPRSSSHGVHVPESASGEWEGHDDLRAYRFTIEEASNGDIVGIVEYGRAGEPAERFGVTGSRLGSGISIWFEQADHMPWVVNGQFLDDRTIRAYLSVGDMILMPLTISRPDG